jgi:DNA repair protein RecO (recombination protein O)
LFQCTGCGKEILPQNQYFSAKQGGVLCPECGVQTRGSVPISMDALKYIRHFQRSNYSEAIRARITPTINQEIENIMQYYMTYLLERGLNTPVFLRRIRKDMGVK